MQKSSSSIFFNPWLDLSFHLRSGGFVGAVGFGGALEGGFMTALGTDFAVGGLAGPSAGAVFAGDMSAAGRLGPMCGLFHVCNFAHRAVRESGGLHPMATGGSGRQLVVAMKLPNDQQEGAGAANSVVRGNETEEPLFGEDRWIKERLRALRVTEKSGREGRGS